MGLFQKIEALVSFCIQLFIIFPYSSLTIRRHKTSFPNSTHATPKYTSEKQLSSGTSKFIEMISEKIYELCRSSETVSSMLAKDPSMAPGDAWKELFDAKLVARQIREKPSTQEEELRRAAECGKWGPMKPSELFLQASSTLYHDALCSLNDRVSSSMVSPPLMGSCGVIPLTIVSTVPDIMRHMSNIIVRAEKEVILATNYWQNSVASKYITNAMKELSKRAGERGERIVFKLEYDRGSPKQLFDNHMDVSEKDYMGKAVALPAKHEIPNIDLEVMNYHRPMLGTFHCKYMIVDRKVAVLQSNNIQDNDNLEMLTHLEGPIVDSLYDMALISWHKRMTPSLPSHNSPAVGSGISIFNANHDRIFSENGALSGHSAIVHPGKMQSRDAYSYTRRNINQSKGPVLGPSNTTSTEATVLLGPSTSENVTHPVEPTNGTTNSISNGSNQMPSEDIHHGFESKDMRQTELLVENMRAAGTTGDFEHIAHERATNGLVSKAAKGVSSLGPNGTSNLKEDETREDLKNNVLSDNIHTEPHGINGPDLASQNFLNSGQQALPQHQIEKPTPYSDQLPEHTTDNPHYDVDIAGEVARIQNSVSPKDGETRVEAVTRHLNHTKNIDFKGNSLDCPPQEEMTPYIPHLVHEAFPIAMVCREPYGTPNHHSVSNPQNAAWLSALRNAKKNVFIQSPTLNAEPLIPAIIAACERGIDIYIYTCLGYNDTGELLPMQGGTNEMIAHKLYISLSAPAKQHLHYFFYTAKDMTYPIVAKMKKRSCHIKVMIVDEYIGIQGNGNQDTQSWYHSQEINVMFESRDVCRAWIDALRRNQNTHLYGEVSKEDGVWRDERGAQAEGVIGVDPGRFSWARGFVGAIERVRGVGDF